MATNAAAPWRHQSLSEWLSGSGRAKERYVLAENSIRTGNTLIRREGDVYGVETMRIVDLAYQTALCGVSDEIRDVRLLEKADAELFLSEVLKEEAKKDDYFLWKSSIDAGTVQDLYLQMNQLRGSVLSPLGRAFQEKKEEEISDCQELTEGERRRLTQIFDLIEKFESAMKQAGACDRCLALKEGIQAIENGVSTHWHIAVTETTAKSLSFLERRFLEEADAHRAPVIVDYLAPGEELSSWFSESLVVKAYGAVNEVRQVAESLLTEKDSALFGRSAVLVTVDSYLPVIQSEFGMRGIPYSIISPYSALSLKKVKMAKDLFDWAESDYLYEMLRPVVMNPVFTLSNFKPEADPNAEPIFYSSGARAFEDAIRDGIGWGLERTRDYSRMTEPEDLMSEEEIEKLPEDEQEAAREERKERLEKFEKGQPFRNFLAALCDAFEHHDNDTAEKLFARVVAVLNKSCVRGDRENAAARGVLDSVKRQLREENGNAADDQERIQMICDVLEEVKMQGSVRPDCVLIGVIGNTMVTDRDHVWILGLSNENCLQNTSDSPAVTDREIAVLTDPSAGHLRLAKNRGREFNDSVRNTVRACVRGTAIFLCCPVYDTTQLQDNSPALVFEELCDQLGIRNFVTAPFYPEEKEAGDFIFSLTPAEESAETKKTDQEAAAADVSGDAYDNADAYDDGIQKVSGSGYFDAAALFEKGEKPKKKEEKKEENAAYDGDKVYPVTKGMPVLSLSPTGFTEYMSCPKRVWFRKHYTPKEEYLEKDPDKWLTGAARGNLFHNTLEYYCNAVLVGNAAAPDVDEKALKEAFRQAYKEAEKAVPADNPEVKEKETEDMKSIVRHYVEHLHQSLSKPDDEGITWQVFACEQKIAPTDIVIAFRKYPYYTMDPGLFKRPKDQENEKKRIEAEGEKLEERGLFGKGFMDLRFAGRIDRIDVGRDTAGHPHLRIIDYKTTQETFLRNNIYGGLEIQHAVYATALEKNPPAGLQDYFKDQKVVVDDALYVLPMGMKVIRTPRIVSAKAQSRENWKLIDSMDQNFFCSVVLKSGQIGYHRVDILKDAGYMIPAYYQQEMTKRIQGTCRFCPYGVRGLCPEYVEDKNR